MKPTLAAKLDQLTTRRAELERLLSDPDATADLDRYRSLTREHAELGPLVDSHAAYRAALDDERTAGEMAADPAMKAFADEELVAARARIATLDATLQRLLLPKDPDDARNAVPRDPRRHRRRRVGAVRRRPAADVPALRRAHSAGRSRSSRRRRPSSAATRKSSRGSRRVLDRHERRPSRAVRAAQVRVGRPSRAARAGHRDAGPHPHVGLHRRRHAGGRRGRRTSTSAPTRSASTRSARRAPAASTSTRPTRRCASRTCRPASSSSARTTAASTRTRRRR